MLFVACSELISADSGKAPQIIDYTVGKAATLLSKREAGFVNAVLRKAHPTLAAPAGFIGLDDDTARLSLLYSHPEWLVHKWVGQWGMADAETLLQWDQSPPPVYARLRRGYDLQLPDTLTPSPWPQFYTVGTGDWPSLRPLLQKGLITIMDPASYRPVELLDVQPGETVLDLCAAPGGKSSVIVERLEGSPGKLVSLDRPGERIGRLRDNLARFTSLDYAIIEADLNEFTPDDLEAKKLPPSFDTVLLDAPCSNTGVLRRRPDAKWRLDSSDIEKSADLQKKLLSRAAAFVKPHGRLVYSTCSIEPEENEQVVENFIDSNPGKWELKTHIKSLPWKDNHDGGNAFLLIKS